VHLDTRINLQPLVVKVTAVHTLRAPLRSEDEPYSNQNELGRPSLCWRGANCISGAKNEVVQHELPRCESDIRTLTLIALNSGTNLVSPRWKDQHIQSVKAGKHGQIE